MTGASNHTCDNASNVGSVTYPNRVQTQFTYDTLHRVSDVSTAQGNYQYTRGLTGNVTYDGANSYLYDGDGRVCAVASTPVPGLTVMTGYIYDAEGARVGKGSITTWSCDPAANGFTPINEYVIGPGAGGPVKRRDEMLRAPFIHRFIVDEWETTDPWMIVVNRTNDAIQRLFSGCAPHQKSISACRRFFVSR